MRFQESRVRMLTHDIDRGYEPATSLLTVVQLVLSSCSCRADLTIPDRKHHLVSRSYALFMHWTVYSPSRLFHFFLLPRSLPQSLLIRPRKLLHRLVLELRDDIFQTLDAHDGGRAVDPCCFEADSVGSGHQFEQDLQQGEP